MSNKALARQVDHIAGDCFARRLRSVNRVVTSVYDQALRPVGVKVSQFNVLVVAAKLGTARPADIGTHLKLDASTVSRNVERMRLAGWLETVEDASDARAQPVRLTALGRALIADAYPLWKQAQEETAKLLGSEGADLLSRISTRLAEGSGA